MQMMVVNGHFSQESMLKKANALDADLKKADALRDAGKKKDAIKIYRKIAQAPTHYAHGLNTTAIMRLAEMGQPTI